VCFLQAGDREYYAFLNVTPDCTEEQIKVLAFCWFCCAAAFLCLLLRRLLTNVHIVQAAYKRLALLWHPDRHKDEESRERATAQFAKLTQIHDVLTGYINLYPART